MVIFLLKKNKLKMLISVTNRGGKIKLCGSCTEARGLKELKLVDGAELSTTKELAELTVGSDKVVTF